MPLFARFKSLSGRWLRRSAQDQSLDHELRFHIEMLAQEQIRQGVAPEQAYRAARLKFGGPEQVKECVREARVGAWLDSLLQDIRFALRTLRKNPGFAAVAIITLALGIGANTAIFSVVQGVLLAPLPYRAPEQLVMVWLNNLRLKHDTDLSYSDFLDWQRNSRSFQEMAAAEEQSYDLTSPGTSAHFDGEQVSSGFFSTLGIDFALGREFAPQEDVHGGAPVAVISNRLWKDRFHASRESLGKNVVLNGVDYAIVGVLPANFLLWDDADVYTPLGQGDLEDLRTRTNHDVICIARLKSGVSRDQALADMNTGQENLDRLYPEEETGLETDVTPLKEAFVGDVRGTLLLLLGAVALVLLIACANIASLLLARSAARSREFSIRSALGAGRARIVRQLITEAVILSLAGGAVGLAAANWGVRSLLAVLPAGLPRAENIRANVSVLLFAFGISIGVGVLSGLGPALARPRTYLQRSLRDGGYGSTSGPQRAQSSLVIVQMALTLILMTGAGLLFRTIRQLWKVDPGFDAQHVITFKVGLSPSVTKTGPDTRVAYQRLIERIREVPGVEAADFTTLVPLNGHVNSLPFWVDSKKPASIAQAPRLLGFATGPDYLNAMRIRLLRGRFISRTDTVNSELVIVIDSLLAHSYFPNQDPVGQTISFPGYGPYRIIGVVQHVNHFRLGETSQSAEGEAYVPFYQFSDRSTQSMSGVTTMVARASISAAAVMPSIRSAVYETGNDQPVYDVESMDGIVSESMSPQRFPMLLLTAFAGLALAVASVGIYGVVSYSVARRTNEIGIRMALGAERRTIFKTILGEGLRLAFIGLAIGMAGSFILARLLSSFSGLLYGVSTSDVPTFAAVSLVLIVVTALACFVPAGRAMRVDPIVALRYE